jgi:predicted ester cyclase
MQWQFGPGLVMDLKQTYLSYIACLNAQDWGQLGKFVADGVTHNGNALGLAGYRKMLEKDFKDIPDLHFNVEMIISEPPYLASRLRFDCHPEGVFLDLPINGKYVTFHENVFYQFENDKIVRVRSVIDKSAIERQL